MNNGLLPVQVSAEFLHDLFTAIEQDANAEFKVDHRWAGVMGVGKSKKPIVKQVSDHVTCAIRMGGMGIALGASIGKQSAELIG